jgi:hypothetical protein
MHETLLLWVYTFPGKQPRNRDHIFHEEKEIRIKARSRQTLNMVGAILHRPEHFFRLSYWPNPALEGPDHCYSVKT